MFEYDNINMLGKRRPYFYYDDMGWGVCFCIFMVLGKMPSNYLSGFFMTSKRLLKNSAKGQGANVSTLSNDAVQLCCPWAAILALASPVA